MILILINTVTHVFLLLFLIEFLVAVFCLISLILPEIPYYYKLKSTGNCVEELFGKQWMFCILNWKPSCHICWVFDLMLNRMVKLLLSTKAFDGIFYQDIEWSKQIIMDLVRCGKDNSCWYSPTSHIQWGNSGIGIINRNHIFWEYAAQ